MQDVEAIFKDQMALGEGVFYCKQSDSLLWVDILKGNLFLKSGGGISVFNVGLYPSCVFDFLNGNIVYLDQKGINSFNVQNQTKTLLVETPYTKAEVFQARGNDGVYLGDGFYLYGTMLLEPTESSGALFLTDGVQIKEVLRGIGIPNMFILRRNGNVLVADSYARKILEFRIDYDNFEVEHIKVWKDFSEVDAAPDGAVQDKDGNIYLAMWDGAIVVMLDKDGNELRRISLPALRPTKCALDKDGKNLFVTTSIRDLSAEQIEKYPMSGFLLRVNL